jgi:hypothetical protein
MAASPALVQAQLALGTSQRGLGERLGVSRRTVVRWSSGGGWRNAYTTGKLAALLYPVDPALAASFAAIGGHTLVSLGLEPSVPPTRVAVPPSRAIDVVVCAAADACDGSPRAARAALLAAVRAAKDVGLDLAGIEAALSPPSRPSPRRSGGKEPASTK